MSISQKVNSIVKESRLDITNITRTVCDHDNSIMNNHAAASHSRDQVTVLHGESRSFNSISVWNFCSQFTYFNFSNPALEKVSHEFTNSDKSKETNLKGIALHYSRNSET